MRPFDPVESGLWTQGWLQTKIFLSGRIADLPIYRFDPTRNLQQDMGFWVLQKKRQRLAGYIA
jgi:hypothetical protein